MESTNIPANNEFGAPSLHSLATSGAMAEAAEIATVPFSTEKTKPAIPPPAAPHAAAANNVQKTVTLVAKLGLISLGLSLVFLLLFWPTVLINMLLSTIASTFPKVTPITAQSEQIQRTVQILIQVTHLYILFQSSHANSYLNWNRNLFLPLRFPLSPLLMLIIRGELVREGGPIWYRDTRKDAQRALQSLEDNGSKLKELRKMLFDEGNHSKEEIAIIQETKCSKTKINNETKTKTQSSSTQTAGMAAITNLFLAQLPKHARRDLVKKITRSFYPRKITTQSVLAEAGGLTWEDFRMIYLGEDRKVRKEKKKLKEKKDQIDRANEMQKDEEKPLTNISIQLDVVDQFIQRALILLLCPHGIIDRYYDADGNYCALAFSYVLGAGLDVKFFNMFRRRESIDDALGKSSDRSGGAVHFSIGYFCLPSEENSGIWHYNICRSMLRGFVCGLRYELLLQREREESDRIDYVDYPDCDVQYVNIGHHEDYAKRSCGAVGSDIVNCPERVKEVCPLGLFRKIMANGCAGSSVSTVSGDSCKIRGRRKTGGSDDCAKTSTSKSEQAGTSFGNVGNGGNAASLFSGVGIDAIHENKQDDQRDKNYHIGWLRIRPLVMR